MKAIIISLAVAALFAGCATPTVTLKNESTGQVVACGGGMGGSLLGGKIGYEIEKSNDEKCVAGYEAKGFKRVN